MATTGQARLSTESRQSRSTGGANRFVDAGKAALEDGMPGGTALSAAPVPVEVHM
jgi:hypothetical protein